MKQIKVYLQYPWKFPDSQYYKSLVGYPPKEIKYLNTKKQKGVIIGKKKRFLSDLLKRFIRKFLKKIKIPIPNAHLTKTNQKYDLIHCAHCLSLNKRPWIVDFEGVWQVWVTGKKSRIGQKIVRKILMSEYCKKIIPWTVKTKKEILREFPELEKKIEVVYPAVPLQRLNKKGKRKKKITIIYATRYFFLKAGLIALETLKRIKQRFDVDIIFISNVPKSIKNKYSEINIKDLVPQKELFKYMKRADIFFYPSFVDTFGFSLLEAMSFGLPVVALKSPGTKAIEEILINGKNGFLINTMGNINLDKIGKKEEKIIEELVNKMVLLIKNKKLRTKMHKYGYESIKKGKFSIKERNKKLERIYKEALK